MVSFRDTDPRPFGPSPAFERRRREVQEAFARGEVIPPRRPPGYAELVDRANRRAAELYPLDGAAPFAVFSLRRAYVAGYVDAALGGDTLRP